MKDLLRGVFPVSLRRKAYALRSAWADAPDRPRRLAQRYFIRHDYTERSKPETYDAPSRWGGLLWQPDVYPEAARIASALGSARIVDLGCGSGEKLSALYPRFEIIGLDVGANLELSARSYPFGTWLEHDLEGDGELPLSEEQLKGAVVVCADVIEHLVRPERLLRKVRRALEIADAAVISTPERNLTWGIDHVGPPPNVAHIREWELGEFSAFLTSEGFVYGSVGLTRSNDRDRYHSTILAKLFPDETRLLLADANSEHETGNAP